MTFRPFLIFFIIDNANHHEKTSTKRCEKICRNAVNEGGVKGEIGRREDRYLESGSAMFVRGECDERIEKM